MPLAYLADPWQKMKVHEEMEVISSYDGFRSEVRIFNFDLRGRSSLG